jgi:hypothetical protein
MVVTMNNAILWDVRHVTLVRTFILEECIASMIRGERISEIGTVSAVTSN